MTVQGGSGHAELLADRAQRQVLDAFGLDRPQRFLEQRPREVPMVIASGPLLLRPVQRGSRHGSDGKRCRCGGFGRLSAAGTHAGGSVRWSMSPEQIFGLTNVIAVLSWLLLAALPGRRFRFKK